MRAALALAVGLWLSSATAQNLRTCPVSQGPAGPIGATGATGAAGASLPVVATPSYPARVIGTTFTPSTLYPTLVAYSVSFTCTLSLSGNQTSTVDLLSDTGTTPTTQQERVGSGLSGTLTIGLNVSSPDIKLLVWLVPAGWKVRLVTSGTCSAVTLVAQSEVALAQ